MISDIFPVGIGQNKTNTRPAGLVDPVGIRQLNYITSDNTIDDDFQIGIVRFGTVARPTGLADPIGIRQTGRMIKRLNQAITLSSQTMQIIR